MRIGIVEDNPDLQELFIAGLELQGHRVLCYDTAGEVLPAFLSAQHNGQPLPVDVLLIDVFLPGGIDGVELVERLRQHITPAQLPIVFLSGDDLASQRIAEKHLLDIPLIRKGQPKLLAKINTLVKDLVPIGANA